MTASKTIVNIAITSDTVCPWCFVGKRRLEKAIKNVTDRGLPIQFNIEYLPYQLDPTMTASVNKIARYESKFGAARFSAMLPHMQQVGLAENITFSYGGLIGNTLDSHRLIGWAKGKNVQYELVEELFKDYFENEKDIADKEVLAEAAVRVGIDKKEAIAFLESKEGTDAVKKNLVKNRNEGIQGVPFYVINNKYRVSGAQEPESFIQIFEKLAAQGQTSL